MIGDAVGLFKENTDYRQMRCFKSLGNTISHQDSINKTIIIADWDPQGYSGNLEFKSVVVYEYELGQKLAIDLEV